MISTAMAIPPIPLQEAFGSGAAALARGGIVTAAVSRCDNEGA